MAKSSSLKSRRRPIMGLSCNPEYNESSLLSTQRFKRTENGKRLAPLSQLNSRLGQRLATIIPKQRSDRAPRSSSQVEERRERDEQREGVGMRSRSHSTASHSSCGTDSDATITMQTHNPQDGAADNGLKHNFPSSNPMHSGNIAASPQTEKQNAMTIPRTDRDSLPSRRRIDTQESEAQPRKYPTNAPCEACVTIPQYLYQEYLRMLPECLRCGHMALRVLHSMDGVGIEHLNYRDGELRVAPSEGMLNWLYMTSSTMKDTVILPDVTRKDSKIDPAGKKPLLGRLQRSKAVRRMSTSASTRTVGSSGRHPGLIPVREIRGKVKYTRLFSFDKDESSASSNTAPDTRRVPNTPPPASEEAAPTDSRLPFLEILGSNNFKEEEPSQWAASPDLSLLQHPAAIQAMMARDEDSRYPATILPPLRHANPTPRLAKHAQEDNVDKKGNAEWNKILTTPARTFSKILGDDTEKAMPPFALRRKPTSESLRHSAKKEE